MINPHRGESEVSLAGQKLKTKLNLDSIVRIENEVGCSIVKIAQKLSSGDLKTSEIMTIMAVAIRGGGNDLDQKAVSDLIWQAGMIEAMSATGKVITSALSNGEEGKG